MKFYSVVDKKSVEVPEKHVTYRTTKNGRKQAVGKHGNQTLYKFVK
jgi:hypothetical protein